jgi:CRISPR-associated endonuclease Cas2
VVFEKGLRMYLVVSYDIHDDKRRNRIHKVLKNFGERIQFSVFECDLTKEQLLRMQHALKRIIKEEDQDSVRSIIYVTAVSERSTASAGSFRETMVRWFYRASSIVGLFFDNLAEHRSCQEMLGDARK